MSELTELLITPNPQLERVALAIARHAHLRLDDRRLFRELDELAQPLKERLLPTHSLGQHVDTLRSYFYDELGFRAEPDDSTDPRLYYLNEVLERRLGVALSVALVVSLVGARVGLPVAIIGFPGRFLVRVGGPGGSYLDLFERARQLDRRGLERLSYDLHGHRRVEPAHLRPVSARDIALALLVKLKRAYQLHREHARAMVMCDSLVEITKGPAHIRDRGIHAYALGAYGAAIDDLVSYLTEAPDARDAPRVRLLLDRALARVGEPS